MKATIGVDHQIVAINNANGEHSICEVYNRGAQQSKFDILCFVHEDVGFHTIGWGNKIVEILNRPAIGLAGVAGATHKSANVAAWWDTPAKHHRMHIVQPQNQQLTKISINPQGTLLSEVVALDGVFLATKKSIWEQFKFDQDNLKGFHFYDTDFSTAVRTKYKVVVTYEVLLTHYSAGTPNTASWVDHALIYHKKWRKHLPALVQKEKLIDKFLLEKIASFNIILRSNHIGYPTTAIVKHTAQYVRLPYKLMFFAVYLYSFLKNLIKKQTS